MNEQRLAKLEWEMPEACQDLVTELEQVNASISEQMDYTSSLLKAIAELHKEHAESLAAEFAKGAPTVAEAMPNTSLARKRDA